MTDSGAEFMERTRTYWNSIASSYRSAIHISIGDFHYGPLIPGDSVLKLLPDIFAGQTRCLEIGCGRAQNSIFLAKNGAVCTASDISDSQVENARVLTKENGADVDFICSSAENIPSALDGTFDLVHSAYALDFCEDFHAALQRMHSLLKTDGIFLFSVGHPLLSGEWIKDDSGAECLLLDSYRNIKPDIRLDRKGKETVRATFRTVSETLNAVIDAGFEIVKTAEPFCLPNLKKLPEKERSEKAPYWSRGWLEYNRKLSEIPPVLIVKAVKR